jgi:hypothetical protein
MKGKALIVSLALVAIPLPAALAAPGGVPGPPAAHPGKATTPAAHPVAFVARGVATSINAGGGSFVIEVKGGNRFLRRAIAGLPSPQALSVKVDAETATDAFTTKITKAAKGRAGFSDVAVRDRVVVIWKAPRGTSLADLQGLEARRVVDVGAAPTP